MQMTDQEALMTVAAWDMYVSAMLGFRFHPGTSLGRAGPPPELETIAELADQMLMIRMARFGHTAAHQALETLKEQEQMIQDHERRHGIND